MVTKGIVKQVINKTQVKVYIPYNNRLKFEEDSLEENNLYIAQICIPSGYNPIFTAGDVVYIAFEDGYESSPVVIGVLYNSERDYTSADPKLQSVTVNTNCSLPSDTTIGNMTKQDIENCSNTSGNLQNQINFIKDKLNNLDIPDVETLIQDVKQIKLDIKDLTDKTTVNTQSISDINLQIGTINDNIDTINDNIGTINSDLSNIKNKIKIKTSIPTTTTGYEDGDILFVIDSDSGKIIVYKKQDDSFVEQVVSSYKKFSSDASTVDITVENNMEYSLTNVSSLTLNYPSNSDVNCHGFVQFGDTIQPPQISEHLKSSGDDITSAKINEIWEFSIFSFNKNGYIIWKNWSA